MIKSFEISDYNNTFGFLKQSLLFNNNNFYALCNHFLCKIIKSEKKNYHTKWAVQFKKKGFFNSINCPQNFFFKFVHFRFNSISNSIFQITIN